MRESCGEYGDGNVVGKQEKASVQECACALPARRDVEDESVRWIFIDRERERVCVCRPISIESVRILQLDVKDERVR